MVFNKKQLEWSWRALCACLANKKSDLTYRERRTRRFGSYRNGKGGQCFENIEMVGLCLAQKTEQIVGAPLEIGRCADGYDRHWGFVVRCFGQENDVCVALMVGLLLLIHHT